MPLNPFDNRAVLRVPKDHLGADPEAVTPEEAIAELVSEGWGDRKRAMTELIAGHQLVGTSATFWMPSPEAG